MKRGRDFIEEENRRVQKKEKIDEYKSILSSLLEEYKEEGKEKENLSQLYDSCKLSNVAKLIHEEHYSREELDDFIHHHLFRPLKCTSGQNQFNVVKNELLPTLLQQERKDEEKKSNLFRLFQYFMSTVANDVGTNEFFPLMFREILMHYDQSEFDESFSNAWRNWSENPNPNLKKNIEFIPYLIPTNEENIQLILDILFLLKYSQVPFHQFVEYVIETYNGDKKELLKVLKKKLDNGPGKKFGKSSVHNADSLRLNKKFLKKTTF
jgi:hypothetical protein